MLEQGGVLTRRGERGHTRREKATGAEVMVTWPPARCPHQELDKAGGTLPWSPQRECGPDP